MPSKTPTAPVHFPDVRPPLDAVPTKEFKAIGYGLIAIASRTKNQRLDATQTVRDLLANETMPTLTTTLATSVHVVKDMFESVAAGDRFDWFTVSSNLGNPSSEFAAKTAQALHATRLSIASADVKAFDAAMNFLVDEPILEMLDSYLDASGKGIIVPPEKEWAYILWSSSSQALEIGASFETMGEILTKANAKKPQNDQHGVMGAWLVHDPERAATDIAEAFLNSRSLDGSYKVSLGSAKDKVSSLLKETDNVVDSPWHVTA